MAADEVTKPSDYGPVIASSNRGADVEPYARRIYSLEPRVWRDVLPQEWIHGSKAEEQAFLRKFFTAREIHLQGGDEDGFRFLKQVWLWNAHWNLNLKIPAIVDQWFGDSDMIAMLQDEKYGRPAVMGPDPLPKTVFDAEKVEMYGEKLLHAAILCIQRRVRERDKAEDVKRADGCIDTAAGRRTANVDGISPTDTNPYASTANSSPGQPAAVPKTDGTMTEPIAESATGSFFGGARPSTIPKASPAELGQVDNGLQRVASNPQYAGTGVQRRPRAGSAKEDYAPQHSNFASHENTVPANNHGQQPFGRKRGYSFNKNQNNHRNFGGPRHDSQQAYPRFEPSYQQPPNFAGPRRPSDDGYSQPFQPIPNGVRMPSNSLQNFIPPMVIHQQQMQGPNNHQSSTQPGAFPTPPPGFDPHMQPGSAQPHFGQHFNFPQNPQGNQAAPFPLFDRVNACFDDNRFGRETSHEGNSSRRGRGGRESNVSRGGRTRGYNNGGKDGKASRGRNSFSGPRQHEDGKDERQIWNRKQSSDWNKQNGDGGFGGRRNTVVSHDWRATADPFILSMVENMPPGRAFSGLDSALHSSQPFGPPPNGHPFAPKPFDGTGSGFRRSSGHCQPNFERGIFVTEFFHDENDPRMSLYPGKLITSTRIGAEAGHVRKLVALGVPGNISDHDVVTFFSSRDLVVVQVSGTPSRTAHGYFSGNTRLVYITFHIHLDAIAALRLRGEHWGPGPGSVKLEVPKEYWDVSFPRYPGQFYDQQPRRGNHPMRDESSRGPVDQPPLPAVAQEVQRHIIGQVKEHNSPDDSTHGNPSFDNATSTASGISTPRKKDKRRKSPKEQSQQKQPESAGLDVNSDDAKAFSASKNDELANVAERTANEKDVPGFQVEAILDEGREVSPESKDHMRAETHDSAKTAMKGRSGDRVPAAGEGNSASGINKLDQTSAISHDGLSQADAFTPTSVDRNAVNTSNNQEVSSHQGPFRGSLTQTTQSADPAARDTTSVDAHEAETEAKAQAGSSAVVVKSAGDSNADTATSSGSAGHDRRASNPAEASVATPNQTEPADRTDSVVKDPPMQLVDNSCNETATGGIASPTKSEVTTIPDQSPEDIKRAPIPVPKVKSTELLKIDNDKSVPHDQLPRTTSGASLSPIPGYATAPLTPVESTDDMSAKNDATQHPEGPVTEQPQKKVEKVKGPAVTESLSMFGKKKQAKPQRPKAQKGQGSIKGKHKGLGDDGIPDGSGSRIASGISTPNLQRLDDQVKVEDVIESAESGTKWKAEEDTKQPGPGEPVNEGSVTTNATTPVPEEPTDGTIQSDEPDMMKMKSKSANTSRGTSPSKSLSGLMDGMARLIGLGHCNNTPALEVKSEKSSSKSETMTKPPQSSAGEMLKANRDVSVVEDFDTDAGNKSLLPVASLSSSPRSGKGNCSKSQPFRATPTGGDGGGVTDSGHSGGPAQSRDAPAGSGVDGIRNVVVEPEVG